MVRYTNLYIFLRATFAIYYSWFHIRLLRIKLVHDLLLLGTDCEINVLAGFGFQVFVSALSAQKSSDKDSHTEIFSSLDGARSLRRLKCPPFVLNLMLIVGLMSLRQLIMWRRFLAMPYTHTWRQLCAHTLIRNTGTHALLLSFICLQLYWALSGSNYS